MKYDLGNKMHEELDIALEMVQSMENPVPTVDQSISNEESFVSRFRGIIDYTLKS